MARGIVIPFTADVRQLLRGMRLTDDAFDDLKRSLDDVGDEADDTERELSDAFRGAATDADRAFDAMRRDSDRTFDAIERDGEGAMRDVADEGADSARELGASFRGDPVEALEGLQELAANVTSKIGGVGGAIAGIGTGLAFAGLITFYDNWRERQEEIREKVIETRDEIVDAFGVLDREQIKDAIVEQLDESKTTISEVETLLSRLPWPMRNEFRKAVQSGDLQGLTRFMEQIDDLAAEYGSTLADGTPAYGAQEEAARKLQRSLGDVDGILSTAVREAQAFERTLGYVKNEADGLTGALDDATRVRYADVKVRVSGASARAQRLLDQGVMQ